MAAPLPSLLATQRGTGTVGYPRINAPGLFRGLFNPALSCKLLCVACPGPPGSLQKAGAARCPREAEEAAEQMLCSQPQDVPHGLTRGKSSWLGLGKTPCSLH